jgi:Luciferase-like monooxygenase
MELPGPRPSDRLTPLPCATASKSSALPRSPGARPPTTSIAQLATLAQRAERNGFTGLLIFYDHMVLDPWTVAAVLLQQTSALVPLVAMQPYTMPLFHRGEDDQQRDLAVPSPHRSQHHHRRGSGGAGPGR